MLLSMFTKHVFIKYIGLIHRLNQYHLITVCDSINCIIFQKSIIDVISLLTIAPYMQRKLILKKFNMCSINDETKIFKNYHIFTHCVQICPKDCLQDIYSIRLIYEKYLTANNLTNYSIEWYANKPAISFIFLSLHFTHGKDGLIDNAR